MRFYQILCLIQGKGVQVLLINCRREKRKASLLKYVHAAWFLGHLKQSYSKLRLSGGYYGYGEVLIDGKWRKLCFHNWESQLTTAVCK